MIDSRRWAKPTVGGPPARGTESGTERATRGAPSRCTTYPSASGPRCSSARDIRSSAAGSRPVGETIPAIPHIPRPLPRMRLPHLQRARAHGTLAHRLGYVRAATTDSAVAARAVCAGLGGTTVGCAHYGEGPLVRQTPARALLQAGTSARPVYPRGQ